ncbi:zinc-binding dehydrogenase [Streptomyces ziwulingensis]|uniref:Zinc-binding dehydrogenase n=1 Tax=Streptomyces ziwulingensis TaxID=1045501 RepID=A0ABP9BUS2_9ACTN
MKAIEIKEFGDPEGLVVVERPAPVPAPGEVLLATEAAGVSGVDTLIRRGALAAHGFRPGHVPGGEVAGVVTAVGEGVARSWTGRRVWAATGNSGGYAEQAAVPVRDVLPLPADVSAVDAVTLGSAGVVAHFGLAHARFAPGERVLVRGASGSLGIMTVQLAARGDAAAVAVTTSSPERGERLRALGATHVLDRRGDGPAEAPADYDVIIDVVAGTDLPAFIDRLAPNGRLVVVGAVGGMPPAGFGTKVMDAFQKSLSFAAFSAATVAPAAARAVREEHLAAVGRGELAAVVHTVLPLDGAAEAHRRMDAGEVFGRIVLTP